jgi:hypothetical protein
MSLLSLPSFGFPGVPEPESGVPFLDTTRIQVTRAAAEILS